MSTDVEEKGPPLYSQMVRLQKVMLFSRAGTNVNDMIGIYSLIWHFFSLESANNLSQLGQIDAKALHSE